jgi:hypothetical protein
MKLIFHRDCLPETYHHAKDLLFNFTDGQAFPPFPVICIQFTGKSLTPIYNFMSASSLHQLATLRRSSAATASAKKREYTIHLHHFYFADLKQ